MFLVRSLQEMPKSFVLFPSSTFPSSTFASFGFLSLCLWSRMGSGVKISHYIQPSNFSSALLFVCVGPTQCCLNVTILQRISSFWNTITNKLEGGRLLRELGSWKLKSTFHKMQIIIIGSKKCQTNKTIFFSIQVCLGSVFCSLHKELIFFFYLKNLRLDNGVPQVLNFSLSCQDMYTNTTQLESYRVLELECTLHNFQ